jgi:hypothetical protein
MAVRLTVTRTGLHLQFSGADLVAACSRGLFVPYTRVLGVRVMTRADAVASSPRLPCPGLWWPQRYRAGCWGVGERRQLWSARHGPQVVVIYLTGRPFHRLVVEVDEPERAHRRIDTALLHSKKTSARRSLRPHRPSATDHREPEPARAEQPWQRHRTPNPDLGRGPGHVAPPRRPASSEQALTPAPGSASATPKPLDLEASRRAWTRFDESGSPPRRLSATPSSSRAAGDTHHDLAAPSPWPPGEIDPSVAARLRLYAYRARGSAPHRGGPDPASTRRGSNSWQ